MSTQTSTDIDVLIVGAGITGLVLAGLLIDQCLRVAVVESRETSELPGSEPSPPDPRALAITPSSARVLESLGVWSHLDPSRIGRFRRMQVWDENGTGEIFFDSADVYQSTLGYIIETNILSQALLETMQDSEQIIWYQPARVGSLQSQADTVIAGLSDGRRVSARLVVAADGKNSRTRSLAGIGFVSHDYQQEALACIVRTEKSHEETARQRFLTDGTLAFLPMLDPYECGIVWSTRPDQVQDLMQQKPERFHAVLASAFDHRLGKITQSGPRMHYPLGYGTAENYISDRLALIGDAAHVVHPLAGQGANLGILDAAALSQIIMETSSHGRDIGARLTLRRYERWRKGDNQIMMQVLTGFKQIFTNQTFPLPSIRNLGLIVADKLPLMKRYIMQYAMGDRGDIPDIARMNYSSNK